MVVIAMGMGMPAIMMMLAVGNESGDINSDMER